MPSASVSTAIRLKPGCFSSIRTPKRKSCNIRHPSTDFDERNPGELGSAAFVAQFSRALPVVSLSDGLHGAGRRDFSAGAGGRAPAADRKTQSVDQRVRHRAGGAGPRDGARAGAQRHARLAARRPGHGEGQLRYGGPGDARGVVWSGPRRRPRGTPPWWRACAPRARSCSGAPTRRQCSSATTRTTRSPGAPTIRGTWSARPADRAAARRRRSPRCARRAAWRATAAAPSAFPRTSAASRD